MTTTFKLLRLALVAVAVSAGGCTFDIANPNTPDVIGNDPSRSVVAATANGIIIATRADVADWALKGGILGREAYRFDQSDPRFTAELMHGPLDPGSRAFGGNHWAEEYAAIRTANDLLSVINTASALSAEEQSATSGFAHTLQAYNFLIVLDAHTEDSIPIDVGTDVNAPPAPFATNAAAYAHVIALLDGAVTELQAGGAAFPFPLPSGFTGFSTPTDFVKFNRALRARVAVYQADFAGALTALSQSFVDSLQPLSLGVYMDYSAGTGDLANPLNLDPVSGENVAHPSLGTGVQLQLGGAPDARFTAKVITLPGPRSADNLSTTLGWIRYTAPNAPIPLIKNEELILLRAEANIGLGDLATALIDINEVRTKSGGLAPAPPFADQTAAITELLYNKRYSLLYEGGHSWVDYRRYGRTADLVPTGPGGVPLFDRPGDVIFPTLPIPNAEVQAHQ
jgi:hypothetical protein